MYEFWFEGVLVGHSALECGDAPMGVAFGLFQPNESFEEVRDSAEQLEIDLRRWQNLSVRTPNSRELECSGGVVIMEYGKLNSVQTIEATCLGIGYPEYEELFPQHVKSYKDQFSK